MKNKILAMIITISMILAIIPAYTVSASTVSSGTCGTNATWTLDSEGTLTISGSGELADNAFKDNKDIKKVIINSGITNISYFAFYNCTNLSSVSIPGTVLEIDVSAFYNCSLLEYVNVPEGVVTVDAAAFYNSGLKEIVLPSTFKGTSSFNLGTFYHFDVKNLEKITVSENNPYYSTVDGVLYDKNKTILYQYPSNKNDTTYKIPDTIKTVGASALQSCKYLKEITLPEGLTTLSSNSIRYCTAIESIVLPKSLTTLSNNVFEGCSALQSVTFEGVISNISESTFKNCSNLNEINLEEGLKSIGDNAFYGCNSLVNVEIPHGATAIGDSAFTNCQSLKTLKLPSTLESLGYFNGCTSLENIDVNEKSEHFCSIDGVLYTKDKSQLILYPCKKTNTVYEVVADTKEINQSAFSKCEYLTKIVLPDNVEIIGKNAFKNCKNLIYINLPNSIKQIGDSALDGCSSITEVIIPNGVTKLSGYLFNGCSSLERVVLSSNIEQIGQYAFCGCTSLKWFNFPTNLTTIGNNAFQNCSSLKNVHIPPNVTSVGLYAFERSGIENVYISEGITTLSLRMFGYCDNLTNISIPLSVVNINSSAFKGSVNLKNIYYAGDSNSWSTITIKSDNDVLSKANLFVNCSSENITSFTLSTNELSLFVGYEEQLSVSILPQEAKMTIINWTSSDEDVAIVDSWGYIRGVSEGIAVIMAEDESGTYMDACIVEVVNPIMVNEIKLSEADISIVEGENKTITSTIEPANATNPNIIWTSSDENIATVENGVVTAISEGEVTITVTSEDGNASASCSVTVQKLYPLTGIKFDSTKLTLNAGDSHTMNVTYTPENATYKNLKWTSSKPAVATVDGGVIKALSAGTTTVVATSEDGGYKATCIVTVVQPVKVTGISLDKNSLSLIKGESIVVNATVSPTDATNKNIIWTSSDTAVATIEHGEIFAIAEGTTTVTATTEDGGYTAACKITVLPIPITGVVLDKSSLSIVLGESEKLTATIFPENAANKSVKWGSNNENIVAVDNGTIKALSIGTAIVTVTTEEGGFKDSCEVTVLPVSVTGIRVDRSELNIIEGTTGTITVTILPENATDKTVLWSSNDEKVATVENGIVTGVGVGTTVIVAKTKDGNYSEYCVVNVSAAHVPVSSITLNTNTMSLVEGYSESLTATINPGNATNKNIVWTSNNETVATVVDGNVTALTPGTAVIIATSEDGGYIATCIVTVSSAMQEIVSAPLASVLSGVVKENTSVILLTATRNADIYYTIDGSAPTTQSLKYTHPISITTDSKIKAIAVKAGMQESNISTFTYSLADPDIPYVNVVTNVTGVKGDITTVSVNTTENAGMAGGSFNLIYDDTVVELLSVNSGTIINSANPIINDAYANNKIRVIWAGTREINTGGEIISAQFRILDTDKEATYFNLEKVKMADGESNKITTQSSDGILTLQEASATTEQEYSTQSTINSDKKSVDVNVTANSKQNACLFVVTYDDKGKLIQLKKTDITNVDLTYTVELEKTISDTDEVKVFIWSSLSSIKPLSTVEIVSR